MLPNNCKSILAVDPGNVKSGWAHVELDTRSPGNIFILEGGVTENSALREKFKSHKYESALLIIEMFKPRGQPTAAEEFETLVQLGRFLQDWRGVWSYVFRQDAKLAVCGNTRARDTHIRQGLIDLFGGQEKGIGGVGCKSCKKKGVSSRRVKCTVCPGKCKLCSGKGTLGKIREICPACHNRRCRVCNNRGAVTYSQAPICIRCEGSGWLHVPGPLYGVSSHMWSALALCVSFATKPDIVHSILKPRVPKSAKEIVSGRKRSVRTRSDRTKSARKST